MARGRIIKNFGFDNPNKRLAFHSFSPRVCTRKSLGALQKAEETLACGWFLHSISDYLRRYPDFCFVSKFNQSEQFNSKEIKIKERGLTARKSKA